MDFFSNIVKNTAAKVETLTKSATDAVNSLKATSPTTEGAPDDQPIDASHENGQLTVESDPKFARSVSGETEGADDDEQIQKGDQDAEGDSKIPAFNPAEISHKAAESAKYFGSKFFLTPFYLITFSLTFIVIILIFSFFFE